MTVPQALVCLLFYTYSPDQVAIEENSWHSKIIMVMLERYPLLGFGVFLLRYGYF